MAATTIHVFGNPDISVDALPLRLLPTLQAQFPEYTFLILDPNEEWGIPNPFIVIDTVLGLTDVHLFSSLDEFNAAPTVSMHDFDALFNLRYLAKLGKLKTIRIIGIPLNMHEEEAFAKTVSLITKLLSSSDED